MASWYVTICKLRDNVFYWLSTALFFYTGRKWELFQFSGMSYKNLLEQYLPLIISSFYKHN